MISFDGKEFISIIRPNLSFVVLKKYIFPSSQGVIMYSLCDSNIGLYTKFFNFNSVTNINENLFFIFFSFSLIIKENNKIFIFKFTNILSNSFQSIP